MPNEERHFTQYEYKEINAPQNQISFYLDSYECFGWKLDERAPQKNDTLSLRRDRKIFNKMELTRLQRHFEACMEEINNLESSKTTKAMIVSLTIGLIGTAFMAGSVFAVTANPPIIWLTVILAIPAFLGWALAPISYKKIVNERTKTINELIEQKYDEIYEICEKGNALIN